MTRPRPIWTAERDAMLRRLVAEGVPRRKCLAPLAALPGAPLVKVQQIAARMAQLGIKLAPEHLAVAQGDHNASRAYRGAEARMTLERLAYLTRAFPDGEDVDVIWRALCAMPGPPIKSPKAIFAHAKNNGIKRTVRKAMDREMRLIQRRKREGAVRRAEQAERAPVMAPRRHLPPVVYADPEPPPEPSAAIADAVTEARYAKVRAALAKRRSDPADIARVHGMPLREVLRMKMCMRLEATA